MKACSEFDGLEEIARALADGADPNHEMFHRKWQERTGTQFSVKQWWGGRRDEPIYGSCTYENYWRTPLACAMEKGNTAIVHALLEAGANPWALGSGESGCARPSAMSMVFRQTHDRLFMVDVLDRHFDSIAQSYPANDQVAAWNNLDQFLRAAEESREATCFMGKLISHVAASQLQQAAPAPSQSTPRRRF